MKKHSLLFIIAIGFFISGCELNEYAVTSVDKKAIFSSEDGLLAYSLSFYEMLPSASTQYSSETNSDIDYLCSRYMGTFTVLNTVSENTVSGWGQSDWGRLRNVNYMITNCIDPAISETVRNNYIGLARFSAHGFIMEWCDSLVMCHGWIIY